MVKVETKELVPSLPTFMAVLLLMKKVTKYTTDDPKFVKGLEKSF